MATLTIGRVGELLRCVFEVLWNKPDGLFARDVLALIPEITQLSDYEMGFALNSNVPRYERIVRLATIPLVKVGWLVKSPKGRWYITDPGRTACKSFASAEELYKEALRLFDDRRQRTPEIDMTAEAAEEKAWEVIEKYLHETRQFDFQVMIASLLRAMGYHVAWISPPEKNRGQINIVAHVDPIGVKGPRILVQILHKGQAVTIEGLKAFLTVLGGSDYGLVLSTGGFTSEARDELNTDAFQKVTALDLESFFDLWAMYYDKLSQEARFLLPLKQIYFLTSRE
jgi:restriction system protein